MFIHHSNTGDVLTVLGNALIERKIVPFFRMRGQWQKLFIGVSSRVILAKRTSYGV
jgi:hypothetical protein